MNNNYIWIRAEYLLDTLNECQRKMLLRALSETSFSKISDKELPREALDKIRKVLDEFEKFYREASLWRWETIDSPPPMSHVDSEVEDQRGGFKLWVLKAKMLFIHNKEEFLARINSKQ